MIVYDYLLAVKRTLRSVYFPVLLIILAFSLTASVSLGQSESMPVAGVCDLDGSISSIRITEYLCENNYTVCPDEETLRQRIASGEYNCGVVIPAGFDSMLYAGQLENAVTFIASPTSFLRGIYENHVTAAIFSELAPIISANSMTDVDITTDEVVEKYRDLFDEGSPFSFDIQYVGAEQATDSNVNYSRARSYSLAIAALLIFVMLMYSVCELVSGDIKSVSHRIGMKNILLHSVIPGMSVRITGIMLAAALSAVVSIPLNKSNELGGILLPILAYCLAVTAFAFFAAALLADAAKLQILTFFIFISALVLCPVYVDISLFVPWAEYVRLLAVPYWLWIYADSMIYAIILAVLLPISCLALWMRFSHKAVE